jgi:hypothetical protein
MISRVVTSAKWLPDLLTGENKNIRAVIDGVEVIVPLVDGNRDYNLVLAWVRDGNTITSTPLQQRTPDIISDRQFFQQLAIQGEITQVEALAYVQTGALPSRLADALDQAKAAGQLTDAEEFNAKMVITGATEFHRSSPLVSMLGGMLGKSPAQIDQIWRDASVL